MAIENKREIAGSANRPFASTSANSHQSSQRPGQARPIYSRQDAGRSNFPLAGSRIGAAQPGVSYPTANNPVGQAAYPVGSYETPNMAVNERVRLYHQNLNTSGSNGFTRQPFDFPQGANGLQQRIAELKRNGMERVSTHANPAQPAFRNPIAGNPGFPAVAQVTQRFNTPQPAQPYNNTQQIQPYSPHQVQPYGNQQQGPHYSSQQGQHYGSQQGQNYSSRPFSGQSEVDWYQAEVERLMSHPGRVEITVPHGIPMGVRTTQVQPEMYFGYLPTGAVEFNQFPVGITTLGTWPYRAQNASGANAQPAPQNQGNYPINTRF